MGMTKDEEILKRGYNPSPKIFIPNDKLIETCDKLQSLKIATTEYEVSQMRFQDALYDAKKFLDYYFKLHRVPSYLYKKIGDKYFHIVLKRHPYKLPIVPCEENSSVFDGSVIEYVHTRKKYNVVFGGITLNKEVTECTSATYVHEITHTQLDSVKKSISQYYNAEVLSMFNELFHYMCLGSDERLLRLYDSRRIFEINILLDNLMNYKTSNKSQKRDELLEDSKYAISILKAYNLFITFYNGNEKLRNEILDDVQCIFDGYLTLEEMLKKYEVTLESSQEEKRLLKYFDR